MGFGTIGLEIAYIPISAVTGAVVLLWLQTEYRRVKLLHGLQQEIKDNIHIVGRAGFRVFEREDARAVERFTLSDDIFRVTRSQTPILYSQLVEGFSPVSEAYNDIEYLRNLDNINVGDEARASLLKFLEDLEDNLIEAGERVGEVQERSLSYRIYNRLFLNDIQQARFRAMEGPEEEMEEKVWRPSGKTANEKREEERE